MVAFVLKLNENQFRKLFQDLCVWATTVPSYAASSTSHDVRAAARAARRVAWFGLVSQLSLALRSVFTPYFDDLLEGFVEVLSQPTAESVPLISGGKKRKAKKKARVDAESSVQEASGNSAQVRISSLAQDRAVSCIHRFRTNDTTMAITQDKFCMLLTPLVARLSNAGVAEGDVMGSHAAGGAHADRRNAAAVRGDEDLQDTIQLGGRSAGKLSASAVGVVAAIVALATSTREEGLWKKTNHQVRFLPFLSAELFSVC
jgi:hypothetical protein